MLSYHQDHKTTTENAQNSHASLVTCVFVALNVEELDLEQKRSNYQQGHETPNGNAQKSWRSLVECVLGLEMFKMSQRIRYRTPTHLSPLPL